MTVIHLIIILCVLILIYCLFNKDSYMRRRRPIYKRGLTFEPGSPVRSSEPSHLIEPFKDDLYRKSQDDAAEVMQNRIKFPKVNLANAKCSQMTSAGSDLDYKISI